MRQVLLLPELPSWKGDTQSLFNKSLAPSVMFKKYLQMRSSINQQLFRAFFTRTFHGVGSVAAEDMSTIDHWLSCFSHDPPGSSLLGITTKEFCCEKVRTVHHRCLQLPPRATLQLAITKKLLTGNFSPCKGCTRPAEIHRISLAPVLAIEASNSGRIPLRQGVDFQLLGKRFQLRAVTRFVGSIHFVAYVTKENRWYMVDGYSGVYEPQDLDDDFGMIGERNYFWFSVTDVDM